MPRTGDGPLRITMSKRKKKQKGRGAALVYQLDARQTDAELIETMRGMRAARLGGALPSGGTAFVFSRPGAGPPAGPVLTLTVQFTGYNDDPRELDEIPEVRDFCLRLCAMGLPSFLDPATTLRGMPGFNGGISLGAFEVWR